MKSYSKIRLGIQGEKFVLAIFEKMLGKRRQKREYRIEHNDFSIKRYPMGTGLDLKILKDGKPLIDAEVKNWNQQLRSYGVEHAQSEVIDRFIYSLAPIKLLFISYMSLLTSKAIKLIRSYGIQIIEIGATIKPNTSWGTNLKHFCIKHYHRLKKFCFSLVHVGGGSLVGQSRLVRYIHTDNHPTRYDINNYDTNIAICKKLGLKVKIKEGNMNLTVTGLCDFKSFG